MKKIVILFLMILACSAAYGSIDSFQKCEKKSCVEGSMARWEVPVLNNINKSIKIEYIKLIDENDLVVAYYDSERNKTLEPGEEYVFKFDQLIIAPPSGYTWYYKPCMRVWIDGANRSGLVCGKVLKSFTVLPRSKAECFLDSDCAANERCDEFSLKCVKLECSAGEAIKNNQCVGLIESNRSKLGIISLVLVVILIIIVWMKIFKPKKTDKIKRNKKKAKKQRK